MKCPNCSKEFSRADALKRHQKTGSCVISQAVAVAAGHSLPPPPPPPHSNSVAVAPHTQAVVEVLPGSGGELVRMADGVICTKAESMQYMPAVPISANPIPWKKYAVVAGGAVALLVVVWMLVNSNRRSVVMPGAASSTMPVKMLGGMENFIPPALISVVGLVFVSKALRGEFKGWEKILSDLSK
jgi:hypothetical protein